MSSGLQDDDIYGDKHTPEEAERIWALAVAQTPEYHAPH